jgi:hypothetical protein
MSISIMQNVAGYLGLSGSNLMAEAIKVLVPKPLEKLVDLGFAANEFIKGMRNGDLQNRIGTIANHLKDAGAFSVGNPLMAIVAGAGAVGFGGAAVLGGGAAAADPAKAPSFLTGAGLGTTALVGLGQMILAPLNLIKRFTGNNPAMPLVNGAAAVLTGNAFGAQQIADRLGINKTAYGPGSMVAKLPKNASFEDLVAAMMFDTVKDEQNRVRAKLEDLRQQTAQAEQSKGGANMGNILGAVAPFLGMIPGVGPILAGAAGMATNAVNGANQGEKGAESRNLQMEELKMMMQRLSEMQQAMSAVLNVMHQTAEKAIANIR